MFGEQSRSTNYHDKLEMQSEKKEKNPNQHAMLVSLDLTFESSATEHERESNWFSVSAGQNIEITELKPNMNQQHPSAEG